MLVPDFLPPEETPSLVEKLLGQFRRARQHHTRNSVARLQERANRADLTNPRIARLLEDGLAELQAFNLLAQASLEADIEKMLRPPEPEIIEGQAQIVENTATETA